MRCLHCDGPSPEGEDYCCAGCRAARALLASAGLDRYYALRGGPGLSVDAPPERDEAWFEEAQGALAGQAGLGRVELEIQGMHCAACVWVVEELFTRHEGAAEIVVNPGVGSLSLDVDPRFDLRAFAGELRQLGYRLGPRGAGKGERRAGPLLTRLGVCVALTMQVMIFSVALYCGLADGPLASMMRWGSWALTAIAVVVGGMPFFRSAAQTLRARALHMDVPISLGILLAFGGSTWSLVTQGGTASYVDTVASFVTLMLLGRFLQERVLERNRAELLADDGVENLLCRVLAGDEVQTRRVGAIEEGDTLLLRPGDLVPVDATLLSPARTTLSREWINGESTVSAVEQGAAIEAGSFHAGAQAATARARSNFASSRLASLLRAPRPASADRYRVTPFWDRVARSYVIGTLTLAVLSGLWWVAVAHAPSKALEVVVAVLVVTCPCAFGLAVPVGFELVQARLRRAGVFVRSAGLLERAAGVRKVIFDKTGTLTLGSLELVDRQPLLALPAGEQAIFFNLAVRSAHPKSRAVVEALGGPAAFPLDLSIEVTEVTGQGVEGRAGDHLYRLGAPRWAADAACPGEGSDRAGPVEGSDLVLGVDGAARARLVTRETLRREALEEIEGLGREGYEIFLLSGDAPGRVEALSRTLGLDAAHSRASASPEDKRRFVAELDRRDTLMVGDGVNDAGALGAAHCSATPAGDLPFLPARTDAYLQGLLVTGVRALLSEARLLDRVVTEAVGFGIAYNVVVVLIACLGRITPVIAAVIMPASSLAVVGWVAFRLRGRAAPTPLSARPWSAAESSPGVA
jgi:Cu2+-exporting ATPase